MLLTTAKLSKVTTSVHLSIISINQATRWQTHWNRKILKTNYGESSTFTKSLCWSGCCKIIQSMIDIFQMNDSAVSSRNVHVHYQSNVFHHYSYMSHIHKK